MTWANRANMFHGLYLLVSLILLVLLLAGIEQGAIYLIGILIVAISGLMLFISSIVSLVKKESDSDARTYTILTIVLAIVGGSLGGAHVSSIAYIILFICNIALYLYGRKAVSNK